MSTHPILASNRSDQENGTYAVSSQTSYAHPRIQTVFEAKRRMPTEAGPRTSHTSATVQEGQPPASREVLRELQPPPSDDLLESLSLSEEGEQSELSSDEKTLEEVGHPHRRHRLTLRSRHRDQERRRKRDRVRMVGHNLHSAFRAWFKDVSTQLCQRFDAHTTSY